MAIEAGLLAAFAAWLHQTYSLGTIKRNMVSKDDLKEFTHWLEEKLNEIKTDEGLRTQLEGMLQSNGGDVQAILNELDIKVNNAKKGGDVNIHRDVSAGHGGPGGRGGDVNIKGGDAT